MVYLPLNPDFQALSNRFLVGFMNDEAGGSVLFHIVETNNPNKSS